MAVRIVILRRDTSTQSQLCMSQSLTSHDLIRKLAPLQFGLFILSHVLMTNLLQRISFFTKALKPSFGRQNASQRLLIYLKESKNQYSCRTHTMSHKAQSKHFYDILKSIFTLTFPPSHKFIQNHTHTHTLHIVYYY